jgi:hypothetical protein
MTMLSTDVEPTRRALFPDAERVRLPLPSGRLVTFVVLSTIVVGGQDYAMLAREDELDEAPAEDLSVYLFRVERNGGGVRLAMIDDDEVYSEVFHSLAALDDVHAD